LLRKALPDLSAVEVSNESVAPFAVIPEQSKTSAGWEKAFSPKPLAPATPGSSKAKPADTKH
jgi:hypothetical protein